MEAGDDVGVRGDHEAVHHLGEPGRDMGEMWARCGRDVGEMWARCGGDMGVCMAWVHRALMLPPAQPLSFMRQYEM